MVFKAKKYLCFGAFNLCLLLHYCGYCPPNTVRYISQANFLVSAYLQSYDYYFRVEGLEEKGMGEKVTFHAE